MECWNWTAAGKSVIDVFLDVVDSCLVVHGAKGSTDLTVVVVTLIILEKKEE